MLLVECPGALSTAAVQFNVPRRDGSFHPRKGPQPPRPARIVPSPDGRWGQGVDDQLKKFSLSALSHVCGVISTGSLRVHCPGSADLLVIQCSQQLDQARRTLLLRTIVEDPEFTTNASHYRESSSPVHSFAQNSDEFFAKCGRHILYYRGPHVAIACES
jgi:hypothetical protein